jgi:hypothetical protein
MNVVGKRERAVRPGMTTFALSAPPADVGSPMTLASGATLDVLDSTAAALTGR